MKQEKVNNQKASTLGVRGRTLKIKNLPPNHEIFASKHHYDADVYPNRHGQICPMRVSRVRFYYVNTLNRNNIAENSYFSRNRQNGREISNPCSQKCPNPSREIQVQTL